MASAKLSTTILRAALKAVIIDGYTIAVTQVEGGYKVTFYKGTDVQELEIFDGKDYVITEEDYQHIADLVDVSKVQAIADRAEGYANIARDNATVSTNKANEAIGAALAATDAAQNAFESENKAKQSEDKVDAAEKAATASARDASAFADTAGVMAQNAKDSAETAEEYKNAALKAQQDSEKNRDDAEQAAKEASESASNVLDLTATAVTLPAGATAKVTKTVGDEAINLEFQIPKGDPGAVTTIIDIYIENGQLYCKSVPESTLVFDMKNGILEVEY